jgi:hypothetical protein
MLCLFMGRWLAIRIRWTIHADRCDGNQFMQTKLKSDFFLCSSLASPFCGGAVALPFIQSEQRSESAAGLKGDGDLTLSPIQSPFLPQEGEATWQRISAMRRPLAPLLRQQEQQQEEESNSSKDSARGKASKEESLCQAGCVMCFLQTSSGLPHHSEPLGKSKQLISPRIVLAGLILDLVPLPS